MTLTQQTLRQTQTISRLLAPGDSNTKLRKNGPAYLTLGLSLSPHTSAGVGNTCAHASHGCRAACLNEQGLASVFASIRRARQAKTRFFFSERAAFIDMLCTDIRRGQRAAAKQNTRLAVRLNVFSDLPWERVAPELFDEFRDVEFYDYTKSARRAGQIRKNYWVTLSRSEVNEEDCIRALEAAANVAVVFADTGGAFAGSAAQRQRLPRKWHGFDVIDGDESDLRFQDVRGRKRGRVVGLRLKAATVATRDTAIKSGFAVPV